MENPILHEVEYQAKKLQTILDTGFKTRKTPCIGAYNFKHRCAEQGLCYYTEEEFIELMKVLGHTPNIRNCYNFSLCKKKVNC